MNAVGPTRAWQSRPTRTRCMMRPRVFVRPRVTSSLEFSPYLAPSAETAALLDADRLGRHNHIFLVKANRSPLASRRRGNSHDVGNFRPNLERHEIGHAAMLCAAVPSYVDTDCEAANNYYAVNCVPCARSHRSRGYVEPQAWHHRGCVVRPKAAELTGNTPCKPLRLGLYTSG